MRVKGRLISNDTREKLQAARTSDHARVDGNDSNTGLVDSAGGAFLTIQAAVSAYQSIDCNGHNVTIQVGDGTYTAGAYITSRVGAGNLHLTGNTTTPADCIISTTSANAIEVSGHPSGNLVLVSGFKLQTTTAGYGLYSLLGSNVYFSLMEFGACAYGHVVAAYGAQIIGNGNYTISGSAPVHMLSYQTSNFYLAPVTVTISGTPAFSTAFAQTVYGGLIDSTGTTWSGSATGARYNASCNGIINTYGSGINYFPGNSDGATATGGQYL